MRPNLLQLTLQVVLIFMDMSYLELIGKERNPGGGCALYIRDNVTFHEKTQLIPPDMEGICGFVPFPNKHNEKVNWFEKMDNLFNNFSNTKLEYVLTCDIYCDLLKTPMDNHMKHFVYTCETHQLTQIIDKPTRIIPNSHLLIDTIMTTNSEKIVEHDVKSVADQCLIYCVTS